MANNEERELLEVTRFAQKAMLLLLGATIDLAIATGGRAETKNERTAYEMLRRITAGIGGVLHAAGNLVRGEAKTSDRELWDIYHKNLQREFVLSALRIDTIGDIGFAERPAAKDFDTHFVALKTAEWCARDLGIAMPKVRWFDEARAGEGKTFESSPGTTGSTIGHDNEIWVHSRLDPRHAIQTVAHEVLHLRQAAEGKARDLEEFGAPYADSWFERDARDYGRITALRLWGPHGAPGGSAYVWIEQAHSARAGNYTPPMRGA